jgi:single-strand DNA-binding protein
MVNNVTLIGRLTADPELKYTKDGTAMVNFTVAYNHNKEVVSFLDATLWGELATKLHPYLKKGKQVALVGELKQRRWEQDGQRRSKVGISVRILQLLDPKEQGDLVPGGGDLDDTPF